MFTADDLPDMGEDTAGVYGLSSDGNAAFGISLLVFTADGAVSANDFVDRARKNPEVFLAETVVRGEELVLDGRIITVRVGPGFLLRFFGLGDREAWRELVSQFLLHQGDNLSGLLHAKAPASVAT